MKEKFNSLNDIQACQDWWEERIVAEEDRTPKSRFERMFEEVRELEEAIDQLDGSFQKNYEAGLELADVFIVGFSVAQSLGFDIERLIFEKLGVNHNKYNVERAKQLREQGLSWQETIVKMKEDYNLKRQ